MALLLSWIMVIGVVVAIINVVWTSSIFVPTFIVLLIIFIGWWLWLNFSPKARKEAKEDQERQKRKRKLNQKYLSENLGARLIHEYKILVKKKSKSEINKWNKKNLKYVSKVKKILIQRLDKENIKTKKNYNVCMKKINKLENRIKKENKMFADIFKRHPFVAEIVKTRSIK